MPGQNFEGQGSADLVEDEVLYRRATEWHHLSSFRLPVVELAEQSVNNPIDEVDNSFHLQIVNLEHHTHNLQELTGFGRSFEDCSKSEYRDVKS